MSEEMRETDGEFLARLGIDGMKWAQEFMRMFGHRKEDIDTDLMLGWFCNAIQAGADHEARCKETAQ